MKKKIKVVVKAEAIAGRAGVSVYIDGELSKNVVQAIDLYEELLMIQMLGEFVVTFE